MDTTKGYTGQYASALTRLDYYHARYYDPAVGVFLSADVKQGNAQGLNPYAYAAENPETKNDPTGQYFTPPGGGNGNPTPCHPSIESCGTSGSTYGGSGSGDGGSPTTSQPHAPGHGTCYGSPVVCASGPPSTPLPQTYNDTSANFDGGCNAQCITDKQLITDYINHQRFLVDTIITLIGDVTSGLADIASSIIDALGGAWGAFALDAASALVRAASVIADLKGLGIFSLPSWFGSAVGILKQVVNVVDGVRGLLDLFNPVGFLGGVLESFISSIKWARITAGILDFVSGTLSPGLATGFQNGFDLFRFNNELAAVANDTPQQALKMCEQDYASNPGVC